MMNSRARCVSHVRYCLTMDENKHDEREAKKMLQFWKGFALGGLCVFAFSDLPQGDIDRSIGA